MKLLLVFVIFVVSLVDFGSTHEKIPPGKELYESLPHHGLKYNKFVVSLMDFGSTHEKIPPGKEFYESLPHHGARYNIFFVSLMDFGSTHEKVPPGKKLYESLPHHKRLDFLTFALGDGYTKNATKLHRITVPDFRFPDALGIDGELIEKFKSLDVPENFTTNLYVWIRARYTLSQEKMRTLILKRSVCLSNGSCIDINDIGGLCCPF